MSEYEENAQYLVDELLGLHEQLAAVHARVEALEDALGEDAKLSPELIKDGMTLTSYTLDALQQHSEGRPGTPLADGVIAKIERLQAENERLQQELDDSMNYGEHMMKLIQDAVDNETKATDNTTDELTYVLGVKFAMQPLKQEVLYWQSLDDEEDKIVELPTQAPTPAPEPEAKQRADELNSNQSESAPKAEKRYKMKWYGVSGWIIIDTETNNRLLVQGESWMWLKENATIFSDASDAQEYLKRLNADTDSKE